MHTQQYKRKASGCCSIVRSTPVNGRGGRGGDTHTSTEDCPPPSTWKSRSEREGANFLKAKMRESVLKYKAKQKLCHYLASVEQEKK